MSFGSERDCTMLMGWQARGRWDALRDLLGIYLRLGSDCQPLPSG